MRDVENPTFYRRDSGVPDLVSAPWLRKKVANLPCAVCLLTGSSPLETGSLTEASPLART